MHISNIQTYTYTHKYTHRYKCTFSYKNPYTYTYIYVPIDHFFYCIRIQSSYANI